MRIYKRRRTWWIGWYQDGHEVRKSLRTHDRAVAEGTLAAMTAARVGAASREVTRTMLEAVFGEEVRAARGGTPIAGAWDAYMATARAAGLDSMSADTLRKRRAAFRRFADWMRTHRGAIVMVEDVTGPIAGAYAAKLKDDGLKDKTRRNTIGDLSTVWTVLAKVSDGIRNPWDGLLPRVTDADVRMPFTRDEEARVLAAARDAGHGWLLACLVARHTGMRYGDVALLERSEVHLAEGVIRYTPNKTKQHGIRVTVPIERTALGPALAEALARPVRDDMDAYVLREHAVYYLKTGHSKMPVQFADVMRAAGVDPVSHTFHSWRHTINTRMGEAGVPMETRKRISGHATDEMSLHYDHAEHLDELRAAIEAASGA